MTECANDYHYSPKEEEKNDLIKRQVFHLTTT